MEKAFKITNIILSILSALTATIMFAVGELDMLDEHIVEALEYTGSVMASAHAVLASLSEKIFKIFK